MVAFLPSPPLTLALLQSCWVRSNSLLWPSRIVRAAQLHRCADADILAGYICFHLKTVFFRLGVRHSVGPTRWIFCDTLQSSLCVHVRHFVLAFSCFLPKFLPNSYNMNLRGKKLICIWYKLTFHKLLNIIHQNGWGTSLLMPNLATDCCCWQFFLKIVY